MRHQLRHEGAAARGPVEHLVREGGAAADAILAANDRAQPVLGEEARAWAALRTRRPKARRWVWSSAIAGGAATAVLLVAVWWVSPRVPSVADRGPGPTSVAEPVRARETPPFPAARPAVVAAAQPAPLPLRAGENVLAGGARVRLSARGRGDVLAAVDKGDRIALARGTLEIDARRPPDVAGPPGPVLVDAGAFSIGGGDARFTVTARPSGPSTSVTVAVHAGRASISSRERALVWVYAGDVWTSPPAPRGRQPSAVRGRTAVPSPTGVLVAPGDARDCVQLASEGATEAAISCFEAQRDRSGLAGELALVELARLLRDLKGDITAAERILAEHGRRFPRGALAAEAGIARIELLLQLGRAHEALAQADALPAGETSFWRGVCLQKLGRLDEARRALEGYLGQPHGTRRAEAMRRLRDLGR